MGGREGILALRAISGIHGGIGNLNVLGGVVGLLDKGIKGSPLSRVHDGDILATIQAMLRHRGLDSAKVFHVKGHAHQFVVAVGSVRQDDFVGNDGGHHG